MLLETINNHLEEDMAYNMEQIEIREDISQLKEEYHNLINEFNLHKTNKQQLLMEQKLILQEQVFQIDRNINKLQIKV